MGSHNEKSEKEYIKYKVKIECLKRHTQLFQEARYGFFDYFRNTKLDPNWILKEIINHGMAYNNRTRQVCIELGWLTKSGHLHESAPSFIRDQR